MNSRSREIQIWIFRKTSHDKDWCRRLSLRSPPLHGDHCFDSRIYLAMASTSSRFSWHSTTTPIVLEAEYAQQSHHPLCHFHAGDCQLEVRTVSLESAIIRNIRCKDWMGWKHVNERFGMRIMHPEGVYATGMLHLSITSIGKVWGVSGLSEAEEKSRMGELRIEG